MSLSTYNRKRDFTKTREPSAKAKPKKHAKPIFVVHDHHASHHHYDLRLEAEGVLKSWAVPKGLSMDPAVKRLAVEVEDHPLSYATFKGDIPEGQYGAGHVAIFDHGTYLSEGSVVESLKAGRLTFTLKGKKLKGDFALVRTRLGRGDKPNWLLIKKADEYAQTDAD